MSLARSFFIYLMVSGVLFCSGCSLSEVGASNTRRQNQPEKSDEYCASNCYESSPGDFECTERAREMAQACRKLVGKKR